MKYLKIFTDFMEVLEPLSDGAAGRLFRAMLLYARDGSEPTLKGKEAVAWTVARQHIDREAETYARKTKHLKQGHVSVTENKVSVSEQDKEKDKYNDKDKDKDKDIFSQAEKKETHPTLEEIDRYIQQTHLSTDGQHFYDYYEANGWRMGQNPMRDWKAALRAWARNAPLAPRPAPAKEQPTDRELFQQAIELHRMKEAKPV